MLVPVFADAHLWFALARFPTPRLQAHKTSRVAPFPEAMWVLDGQHIGRGDDVAHALHLLEQRRFRILLLGHLFNPPIVFLNTVVQRFDLSQQWIQRFAQSCARSIHGLPTELLRATLA